MIAFNEGASNSFDATGFVETVTASVDEATVTNGVQQVSDGCLQGVVDEKRRKIRSALMALPASFSDNYEAWMQVCFALHSLGEDYFEEFVSFSSQSRDKFQGREDCRTHWDSVEKRARGKRITVGTLLHYAKQNGWRWSSTEEVTEVSAEERYPSMSMDDLLSEEFEVDYVIDECLVAGQPCIIGGPPKALKTTFMLNAAYHLSIGGKFLGEFGCRLSRVLVMTGESGAAAIQQKLKSMVEANGGKKPDGDYFQITESLPKFASESDIESLRLKMQKHDTEVVFIDPAYLTMGGADAGNLQSQGELLRAIGDMCREEKVTLVLAHHVTKEAAKKTKAPLELGDLVWAGFSEWTRQWWMVNRRSKYAVGSGKHELRLNVGNSARHSAIWAIDVDEGTASDPFWQTTIVTDEPCEVELAEKKRKQKFLDDCDRVRALLSHKEVADGLSQTAIADHCKLSGAKAKKALAALVESKVLKTAQGKKKGSVVYLMA